MHVDTLSIGPILTNCYLVTCSKTKAALVIDPGWNDPELFEAIENRSADVKYIVNTHTHWDHIGGNAAVKRSTGAPLALHQDALVMLQHNGGADAWNIPLEPSPEPDLFLEAGQMLEVGKLRFKILFTPGHAPGHISLYEAKHRVVFDGDVLFQQGIGRVDLPGGDMETLMRSIKEELLVLPDDVVVYSGHGPQTTIGAERESNPWLRSI